jgi:shikimate dehydrogenase
MTTVQLGLLGNGITRSRAKKLHELLGEMLGLDVRYEPMDLSAQQQVDIKAELLRCQQLGFTGVNVTHPYKREAFQYVNLPKDYPKGLSSVNTVRFKDTEPLSDNTDYSGFCRAYQSQFGQDSTPGRVLMLGAGGVGLAIAFGLQTLKASELVLYDTNPDLTRSLIAALDQSKMVVREAEADLATEMKAADGLINATPIGMYQYPGNPFPESGFGQQRWAFDAVYTPENTAFMNLCRKQNIATLSGFQLFLYQGLDAFRHFTGLEADARLIEREFLKRYPLNC